MSMDYIWLEDKLEGEYKEVFDKAKIFAGMQNVNGDICWGFWEAVAYSCSVKCCYSRLCFGGNG